MEILSPVWPDRDRGGATPARPRALAGATVALVDDNLDVAFTTHLELLLGREHGATVRRLVKPSGTAPSPGALIDEAVGAASVAIVGIGL